MHYEQWTVTTLGQHMDQRLDDLIIRLDERHLAQQGAVTAALASAEKAVAKAETANEKRFENVNEFRAALSDQTATLLTRTEYETAHEAVVEKINISLDRISALELRLTSRLDIGEGSTSGQFLARTERRLDLGQLIAVVAVIVAVISVTAFILKK